MNIKHTVGCGIVSTFGFHNADVDHVTYHAIILKIQLEFRNPSNSTVLNIRHTVGCGIVSAF